ncbi:oxaloacetate decarboxylase subunit alpha [Candidatus Bathyarchaeota archaeon]|nr:oxaloacetate decarboxylase subunit alpha [Candidatus Bathyarchaeota archaeon]NIU81724.1 oxaloacetate decarboxylase subunit alpha [Candidatus Bathyarchaeota archaeon]NIV68040.1 oxaloacetate decarboxylase subunit alpha [Candidatus Bathyarchaeota archaeon]NIW16449.1 oxaloacetate decarboxylase subunit alpha [Candidatus Bathyarchaeota archaeon]NIW34569.1 oxaloacetate decarboxylase subunit alpha [Candidatus Bathyarchaeota archaeon]
MRSPVRLTDTTFRDAHQSLMATRMRTESMLPIAPKVDQVGFFSLEVWGGATFDVCLRYLKEDPWERVRELKKHIRKTPLQMLLRGQNIVGYKNYPDDVLIKFIEKAAEVGIDIFRIFDAVNDTRNLETSIKTVKKVGAHAQGSVCYTISPVHTTEHYVKIADRLADLGCDSICIKDMAGMLAPKDAYQLVSALKEQVGLSVHLHCHSTSGMALMTYLKACEAGVDIIDTAFSPLAMGTSQPPVETVVAAFRDMPYDPRLDLELLMEISEYFRGLREKYYDPLDLIDSRSESIDTSILIHQIPGGMFSNLISQLKEQNALDRLQEVLDEVPRVREDLGYPPLVTPTSQLVGTQAVFNVLSGERYKIVPKEVKDYVRGFYGRSPAPIEEEIKKKIIGDEEIITCRPADLLEPQLQAIPKEARQLFQKEEDALTYVLFPKTALEFFQKREEKPEEKQAKLGESERQELEEVAALSTAVATYLDSVSKVSAVIPVRESASPSAWTLAGRQEATRYRGFEWGG